MGEVSRRSAALATGTGGEPLVFVHGGRTYTLNVGPNGEHLDAAIAAMIADDTAAGRPRSGQTHSARRAWQDRVGALVGVPPLTVAAVNAAHGDLLRAVLDAADDAHANGATAPRMLIARDLSLAFSAAHPYYGGARP